METEKNVHTPNGEEKSTPNRGMSLKKIFLGDFLLSDFLRRQALLAVLLMVYTVIYVGNRYACQKELVEIDKLRKELVDIKYDALTRSSELTERTRQSRIEEYVSSGESRLQMSTTPPYLVEK